jgi:hypothetical protein
VLVSGVSAAFSIKLTLTPARLQEAIKSASLLRRGMIHPRNEPIWRYPTVALEGTRRKR